MCGVSRSALNRTFPCRAETVIFITPNHTTAQQALFASLEVLHEALERRLRTKCNPPQAVFYLRRTDRPYAIAPTLEHVLGEKPVRPQGQVQGHVEFGNPSPVKTITQIARCSAEFLTYYGRAGKLSPEGLARVCLGASLTARFPSDASCMPPIYVSLVTSESAVFLQTSLQVSIRGRSVFHLNINPRRGRRVGSGR